jgi:hypothetical protein
LSIECIEVRCDPAGLGRQSLDMARHRIVAFVAMHVDHQPALCRDPAQRRDRSCAVFHGAFEMRDAADDIHPHVERAGQRRLGLGAAVIAVLREGDQLQVDIGRDPFAHLEQRLGGDQARVRDIDMAADRQQALGHRQIAIAQRPFDQRLARQGRTQFAPERDAFKQRARDVHPRQTQRQGGVHVEMRIDEGRADQQASGVDHLGRLAGDRRFDRHDATGAHPDIEPRAPIGKRRIADEKIEHLGPFPESAASQRLGRGRRNVISPRGSAS